MTLNCYIVLVLALLAEFQRPGMRLIGPAYTPSCGCRLWQVLSVMPTPRTTLHNAHTHTLAAVICISLVPKVTVKLRWPKSQEHGGKHSRHFCPVLGPGRPRQGPGRPHDGCRVASLTPGLFHHIGLRKSLQNRSSTIP